MSAKSVWSLPTPTLFPGRTLVPRCRTMIVPASTRAPAYSLTPSRWPALSRPLRVEPAPFLCAISLRLYLRDAEGRLILPVTAGLPRPRLVLVLEHADLGSSSVRDDLGRNDGVGHERGPGTHANAVGKHQHLVEDDGLTRVARTAIDGDRASLFDPVAPGTATDDRVHGSGPLRTEKVAALRARRNEKYSGGCDQPPLYAAAVALLVDGLAHSRSVNVTRPRRIAVPMTGAVKRSKKVMLARSTTMKAATPAFRPQKIRLSAHRSSAGRSAVNRMRSAKFRFVITPTKSAWSRVTATDDGTSLKSL